MWREIRRYLRKYPSAVLTGLDSTGYPFSVRCQSVPDDLLQALRVAVPDAIDLRPGPASLLCHSHNLFLWNLHSFLVRGSLERIHGSWIFRPAHFVPGIGVGGLAGMIRFATSKRRAANRYLQRRGLERPKVPWSELRRLQRAVRRS